MIGSTLNQLLTERKMSVAELANRVGVSGQTLYSIRNRDNMTIDLDLLMRICRELEVPLEYFCHGDDHPAAVKPEEMSFLGKYRALDDHGKEMVDVVLERELDRVRAAQAKEKKNCRIIPLYLTPAAAGYASPALGEDYEDYSVDADCPADFAVKIDGDSMEPYIHDGGTVLVQRAPIAHGDVGMFFVDGDMKCKQYCKDNFGNVYLISLNRNRSDADVMISRSSGLTLCCFGKVLLERHIPALL